MNRTIALAALVLLLAAPGRGAAEEAVRKPSFEVYGFAQVDYIQDFRRVNPDWNAMLRPSKIPTTPGLYGSDGEAIFSVRQSRLGVQGSVPAGPYDVKAKIEFDFFGRGTGSPDSAGQNTIRLRRAYGEWGPVLGGLTASLFMDDDWWPNIIEYWGPSGMVFFRNVQVRYTFFTGEHTLAVALERPGTDLYANYDLAPQVTDLAGKNELPDLTAQYRYAQPWGYVQLSGILRRLGWERLTAGNSGHTVGYGLNLSSTLKLVPNKVHLLAAVVGGRGIENYMNDATPDLAASGDVTAPTGEAVGMLGASAYVDVFWTDLLTSSFGYSMVKIWTTNLQDASAYSMGQYASGNVLVHPVKGFLLGPEFLWGRREDKGGAWGNDYRLQISLKYNFSSLDFWKPS
jgi:hypothetical protein